MTSEQELNKKLAEWRFDKVELRAGFYGDCGEFVEMQSNPYSDHYKDNDEDKTLCYSVESEVLTDEELATYKYNFERKSVKFIPNKYEEIWNKVPEFTQSLDACFKWLVPKLRAEGYFTVLRDLLDNSRCNIVPEDTTKKSWFGQADKLALALCLAIEKLIDSKVKSSS